MNLSTAFGLTGLVLILSAAVVAFHAADCLDRIQKRRERRIAWALFVGTVVSELAAIWTAAAS